MNEASESKYGFTKPQLKEGYIKLKEKGAEIFGLHSFLASNTLTDEYYPTLAALLFETAVWIKNETGITTSFINLSGGVGIPYKPEERANDIDVIAGKVEKAFNEILIPAGLGNIAIYTEMGRFMLGPHGCLVTTALHKKSTYKNFIGLDACSVDLIRPAMYGAYHHISVSGKEELPPTETYDVTGSLCENNDKFAIDRPLPPIERGDLIVIHDTGAHGYSMGYNYNGRLRSAELLLCEDGEIKLIRRAEKPADYFSTLSVTPYYNSLVF
jgi:diaminopimelate decarboxylase